MVNAEGEMPLVFSGLLFALVFVDGGEEEMRLDDAGFEARGLFDFGLGFGSASQREKGQAVKIAQLGRLRIFLQRCPEGLNRTNEIIVAGVPAAKGDCVVLRGMGLEACDKGGWSFTHCVRAGGQSQEASQYTCGESRARPDQH